VDVHNSTGETSEKFWCKDPHETCQGDEINPVIREDFHELLIIAFPIGVFSMGDNEGSYILFPGTLKGISTRDIADDDTNQPINPRAIAGIHDRLKVGAAP
jgi:hypothetical protein